MTSYKPLFYDWMGLNEWLFKEINALDGDPNYNAFMIFLSHMADHHNFAYIFTLLAFFAVGEFLIKKIGRKGGAGQALITWVSILCVFGASYAVDGMAVKTLKEHFSYPRPYAALGPQDVTVLEAPQKTGDDYHSFPSGHASFIAIVVASLWPLLMGRGRIVGALLIAAACWSRLAMGMHFPADVLAGVAISFFVVIFVRAVVFNVFRTVFRMKI